MSEYGYIPESPAQSWGSNKGIFTPNDIYDLTRDDKFKNLGQLELIETKTGSGVSAIDFTDIKSSTYDVHFMTVTGFVPTQDGQPFGIRLSNDGSTFISSGYNWANLTYRGGGTFADNRSTSSSYLEIGRLCGNSTNEKLSAYIYFYHLGDSAKYSFLTQQATYYNEFGEQMGSFGSCAYPTLSQVNGIRLCTTSNNITVTAVTLYGIKMYKS
tara:strand:- start:974 stop:1612 length:639 start_codon:yes stop_codon:yes gene_type:complete